MLAMSAPLTDALTHAVAALHQPGFPATLVALLRQWAAFDCALVLGHDRRPLYLYDTLPDRRELLFERYLTGAHRQDPFLLALQQGLEAGVWTLNEVSRRAGLEPDYVRAFYRATGWREELGLHLPLRPGFALVIFLGRLGKGRPVSAAELARLRQHFPLVHALCRQHWGQMSDPLPAAPPGREDLARIREIITTTLPRLGGPHLTRREREVATLILHGLDTETIALRLAIAPGTVKNHRKHLYAKLGLTSRADLFTLFLGQLVAQ